MTLNSACRMSTKGAIVSLKDKGRGYGCFRITNDTDDNECVDVFTVDGCLIKEGVRCDYLVLVESKAAIFVELKGIDVEAGLKQLLRSIELLRKECVAKHLYAVLVPTRWPLAGYSMAAAQDLFRRKFNCRLKVKNVLYACVVSDF